MLFTSGIYRSVTPIDFSNLTNTTPNNNKLQTNRTPLHFTAGSASAPLTCVHHRDNVLLSQQKGGIIKSWSLTNSGFIETATRATEHTGYCRFVCSPESESLLMASPTDENAIVLLNGDDLLVQQTLHAPTTQHPSLGLLFCLQMVKVAGQMYLLAGYESGDFLTWDLRCGKVINAEKFDECPMAIDYEPNTNRGIYGGPSNKLGIISYDRNTMQLLKNGEIPLKNAGVNCINIRKDQKVFSAGGWDGRIRIFSWKSLRPLAVLTDHKAAIMDISYSSDKVALWKAPIMAAGGIDGQISLWDLYN